MRWLICYDIADEKRLRRVRRLLSSCAMMLQYSVYVGDFTEAELAELVARLRECIAENADDVRLYPLTPRVRARAFGKGAETAEALLAGAGVVRIGEEK